MNSKMIAIIAVVAMCGAALVGVGYAYQATITNDGNSVTSVSEYATIALGDSADATVTIANAHLTYNYDANAAESKYYKFAESSYTFTDTSKVTIVTKNPASDITKITLSIVPPTITENCDAITGITLAATTASATGYTVTLDSSNTFVITKADSVAFDNDESVEVEVTFTLTVNADKNTAMNTTYEINSTNLAITYTATPGTDS